MKISFHNKFGWKVDLSDFHTAKKHSFNRIHFFLLEDSFSFNSFARLYYKFD